jgi:hypothetical protein
MISIKNQLGFDTLGSLFRISRIASSPERGICLDKRSHDDIRSGLTQRLKLDRRFHEQSIPSFTKSRKTYGFRL